MRMRWRVARWLGGLSFVPRISDPVVGGDVLRLAGRDWFVVHTPGHTEDHFCLHDPDEGLFLAGDHVLPTITPHISGLSTRADPLAAYFESLDRVADDPAGARRCCRPTAIPSTTSAIAAARSRSTTSSASSA